MNLKGRNFLTLKDFTPEEITYLIYPQNLKQRKKPESFMNITRAKTLR